MKPSMHTYSSGRDTDGDRSPEAISGFRRRFLIPYRADEYRIIPVSDVSHIAIDDGIVHIFTLSGCCYAVSMTLDEIEHQLDPRHFMRINRQYIINDAAISKLSTPVSGRLCIHINGYPDTLVMVGKDKSGAVKRWLDT